MSILDQLDNSFATINNSFDHTIHQMNWSHISEIKSKDTIRCPFNHQVKDICMYKNCRTENSLICLQDSCCFRSSHSICQRKPVLGITRMIEHKTFALDQIKFQAQIFFDQKQQKLREFRSSFMKQIDQIKDTTFSDAQLKLKKVIDSKSSNNSFNQITGKESAVLLKSHEIHLSKRQDEMLQRTKQAFVTFDLSLKSAFDELTTDFSQINEDAKNPSLISVNRANLKTVPNLPIFSKQITTIKTQNPEISGRKRFADFIGQQINNRLTTPSKQIKIGMQKNFDRSLEKGNSANSSRSNKFDRSGEKGNSANSSRKSLSKKGNENQRTLNSSKDKPVWRK